MSNFIFTKPNKKKIILKTMNSKVCTYLTYHILKTLLLLEMLKIYRLDVIKDIILKQKFFLQHYQ